MDVGGIGKRGWTTTAQARHGRTNPVQVVWSCPKRETQKDQLVRQQGCKMPKSAKKRRDKAADFSVMPVISITVCSLNCVHHRKRSLNLVRGSG
jgi:hypothetical protein